MKPRHRLFHNQVAGAIGPLGGDLIFAELVYYKHMLSSGDQRFPGAADLDG